MSASSGQTPAAIRIVTLVAVTLLGAALAVVMFDLPSPTTRLAQSVQQHLADSGVRHPVTAVLLNFRAYDTLLEIAVLLLAVFGVLALRARADHDAGPPATGPTPVLAALVHLLVPVMVVLAGYLLWAGAHRPGGAFQAGAVLAAAGVLLRLTSLWTLALPPSALTRIGLLLGLVVFLGVALGASLAGGVLLELPRAWAGELILLIEATLSVSIGLMLLGLFSAAPAPGR
ncbi:MnhB domain-containing protein [Rhodoferax sp.]|uniref:MnhB domain-containing protein n=1 Tax=Rhodoferax sp. TaxID=50421 RepID=UPI0027719FE9|nr:MnhB domain-containing protein [Reyranella sp.]MDP2367108.1 MnhB domain-containing protein [Rhodoferax sp.]